MWRGAATGALRIAVADEDGELCPKTMVGQSLSGIGARRRAAGLSERWRLSFGPVLSHGGRGTRWPRELREGGGGTVRGHICRGEAGALELTRKVLFDG